MDEQYLKHLTDTLTDKDNLKLVREEAAAFHKSHTAAECFDMAMELYQSEHFQVQEAGVFLCGHIAAVKPEALAFLKETASVHPSWKVQEVLAMAFDTFCKANGYLESLPVIHEWLDSDCANTRRAVTEGLRIWTSRPHFKEHPEDAVALLAACRNDGSDYVRKSAGNALRDISKKHPDLIKAELSRWDTSSKPVMQVYRLAGKLVMKPD